MIASLPMYDLPPMQGANDRFWQAIRSHLDAAPDALTRGGDLWAQWLAPDLVFSQTCGYPYRAKLHGKVTLVGTPDYGLPDCPPGHYRSIFVARKDDPREDVAAFEGARFAYNEPLSQSGWAAPATHVAALGFGFDNLLRTGGHRHSALAVAEGRAELAALDALTWTLLRRYDGFTAELKEVGATSPTPVLPYICALDQDSDRLFAAVTKAIETLDPKDRETLHIKGLLWIPAEAYLAVSTPPAPAGVT